MKQKLFGLSLFCSLLFGLNELHAGSSIGGGGPPSRTAIMKKLKLKPVGSGILLETDEGYYLGYNGELDIEMRLAPAQLSAADFLVMTRLGQQNMPVTALNLQNQSRTYKIEVIALEDELLLTDPILKPAAESSEFPQSSPD